MSIFGSNIKVYKSNNVVVDDVMVDESNAYVCMDLDMRSIETI